MKEKNILIKLFINKKGEAIKLLLYFLLVIAQIETFLIPPLSILQSYMI